MPAAAANDAEQVDLSVVVPTWGRLDQLDSCLDALARQTLAPARFEIIVVDDDPDHNTLHLVSSWRTRRLEHGPRLIYLANPGPHGAAAARNRGWRVARAGIIGFTDDAAIPAPDWLEQALAAFASGVDVPGVATPGADVPGAATPGVDVPGVDALCGKISMSLVATPTEYQRHALRKQTAEFA